MKRWGGALTLGACVTTAALAFGSRPIAVAGLGLLLAGAISRVWSGLARSQTVVSVLAEPEQPVEGDRVRLHVLVSRGSRVPVGSAVLWLDLGKLGARELPLRGRGKKLRGELDLGVLDRGVFPLAEPRVVLGDHLGLGSVAAAGRMERQAVAVRPRIVGLRSLFGDAGAAGGEGRRFLLRQPAGFDFHSVRTYEQGESLRRVHWPTTARRGQLMVKELHDAPGDEIAVVLDCDPAGAAGTPPRASFDTSVRAAASILAAQPGRGRTATLVTTDGRRSVVSIRSEGELDAVLTALAAVEPDARHGLGQFLRASEPTLLRASETIVITGAPVGPVAPALLRMAAHRPVSVVWVDSPSFAGRPTRADPGALRLAASGVPVAVVRDGDDLASVLELRVARSAVRA